MVKLENISRVWVETLDREILEVLVSKGKIVRLERAISPKSDTPSKVYDQDEDEFVMVAKGYAEIEFEEDGRKVIKIMREGDYTIIPAHLKHRVTKTEEGTAWLALF